jgi:putative transposase
MDNIFIERLWRTLKYECIYLHAFETGSETRRGISRWVDRYNHQRPHSSLSDRTPDEAYRGIDPFCRAGFHPVSKKGQTAA